MGSQNNSTLIQGIIFYHSLVNFKHTDLLALLHKMLPESLLEKYGLAKAQTTEVAHIGQLIPLLIALKTDELFAASLNTFNREFTKAGGTVYSYHLDRGNPLQSPMHGVAHHALDLAYTFGNFDDAFSETDIKLSKTLMTHWIEFANGKEPWASYKAGKALYAKPDAEVEVVPREKVTSRRWEGYAEMEKCWESVRKTGNMLMNGKLEEKGVL